ncbi:MAG: UxaA family hydrolase [Gammaproteobacteria bacterium]
MSPIPHLLVHHRQDNVGVVVVEGLTAGTEMLCVCTADNSEFFLRAVDAAPLGHKIALSDLLANSAARKYGEDIGVIVADVAQGGHVHTHNLKTKRW